MQTAITQKPAGADAVAGNAATMTRDVVEVPARQVIGQSATTTADPAYLLQLAVERNAPPEQISKFMDLYERFEAMRAERAYNASFAAFKAEAVTIIKSRTINDGPLKGKKHADLFDVVAAVTPALSKHGLTISWKLTKDEKDWLEVTCYLKHELGHQEAVPMGGEPDTGPGRNKIQARGSTKSYLERYTALAILGMAAREQDDDGKGGADEGPDLAPLLVGLGQIATDQAAATYWQTHRIQLREHPKAYEKFKQAVVDHRNNLRRGAE